MNPETTPTTALPSHRQRVPSWLVWGVALLVITLLGAWLRLYHLTTYPTWWDEHVSVFGASGQIATKGTKYNGRVGYFDDKVEKKSAIGCGNEFKAADVGALKTVGNIPAAVLFWDCGNSLAFACLLSGWISVFGFSDTALRLLPCVLSVLTIPAVFAIGWRATGLPGVGLLAGIFVATNALLVQFAREVRSYSLAVLLCLLATYVFIGFFRDSSSRPIFRGIIYATLLAAIGLTHYLAVPVLIVSHFIGALIAKPRLKPLGVWACGVGALALVLGYWMIWGGFLGIQAMHEHDQVWLSRAVAGGSLWLTPFDWRTGVRLLIERTIQFNIPLFAFWPPQEWCNFLTLGSFLLAAFVGLIARLKASERPLMACMAIITAFSAGGFLSVYLSWKSGHTLPFLDRYFTFYIPFQCLLLGLAISGIPRLNYNWVRIPVAATLIAGSAFMVSSNVNAALKPKQKETFSFDHIANQIHSTEVPGILVRCDSLDSALILALKTSGTHPDLRIVIDPKAKSKAGIEAITHSTKTQSHE